jgi:hypothetical protein
VRLPPNTATDSLPLRRLSVILQYARPQPRTSAQSVSQCAVAPQMKKCSAPPVVVRHFTVHNAPFAKVSAIHSAKAPFGVCHRFAPFGFSKQALCKVPFRGQGLCRSFRALRPLRVLPVRSSHGTSFGAPPFFYSQSAPRCCVGSSAPPTPAAAGASRLCRARAWAYPSAPEGLPYTQALRILLHGGCATIAPAARARIPHGLAFDPSLFRADCAAQPLVSKGQALRVDKPRQMVAVLCHLVTRFLKP